MHKQTEIWITEEKAVEMLGGVCPRTLRRKAKVAAWKIAYTHINFRHYQYSLEDIQKFLLANSNKTKAA